MSVDDTMMHLEQRKSSTCSTEGKYIYNISLMFPFYLYGHHFWRRVR